MEASQPPNKNKSQRDAKKNLSIRAQGIFGALTDGTFDIPQKDLKLSRLIKNIVSKLINLGGQPDRDGEKGQ